MDREEARELLPAIKHFANGGELCYMSKKTNKWLVQGEIWESTDGAMHNIIKDKHFEARKAFALGKEIEYSVNDRTWSASSNPSWDNSVIYRPKPKEVHEWQYTYPITDKNQWDITPKHYTNGTQKIESDWIKFEPSKRLRKDT